MSPAKKQPTAEAEPVPEFDVPDGATAVTIDGRAFDVVDGHLVAKD